MRTTYSTPPACAERLNVVLPVDLKRQVFETAAKQGIPASQFIRQAISAAASAANKPRAA